MVKKTLKDKLNQAGLGKPEVKTEAGGIPPHVEVQALAGTGKTTTAVEGIKKVKGISPAITPSPQQAAVWDAIGLGRTDKIRLSSFSTSITNVLKQKLEEAGLGFSNGVEARGIHSLGNGAVFKAFGALRPDNYMVRNLVSEKYLGLSYKDLAKENPMDALVAGAVDELVGKCKQTLCDPTPENLDRLCNAYEVEFEEDDSGELMQRVYDLVPQVLEDCKRPKEVISFDDQIWLPLIHHLPIYKVDLQIVDEAQDLNNMQQALMLRAGKRLCFIGDDHQAIFGFAGANVTSMSDMRDKLTHTPGGCTSLPLTVTRRCGKAIVEEARQYVETFEAHESNCEGEILEAKYTEESANPSGNYWKGGCDAERQMVRVPVDKTYLPMVQRGDLIICRCTAPLVSQCFKLLKMGKRCQILGRKTGEGLNRLLKASKAKDVPSLIAWLEDWRNKEFDKENAKKNPSDQKLINTQDKYECMLSFCEGCGSVDEIESKINSIFSDTPPNYTIRLATIHKAKGLEARQVFFLRPRNAPCPHPMARTPWAMAQEYNLLYVAITRAIERLVYVY